ncbi:MAG: hypothetical protein QOG03_652 [Actinomycetota bacterium]|jgi:G6PDH family F420-dependent oxidoreductase|nr:hypothetical protein [Actinomycetota bacterium]
MAEIGYSLSSEEWGAKDLVALAQRAEEVGFTYAGISDHFHPWTTTQGNSPFVWAVIGGIAATTTRLRLGTGVTCPTIRIHPAIIAQAAATAESMMPGRFFLGVGSGENLNEHILGDRWPESDVRQEMLEEAVEVIRLLWQGGMQSHHGKHYTVENACIFSLPSPPPPIYVAAAGPKAAKLAGRIGDGLIAVAPQDETVKNYREAGGSGPTYGHLTVCWAESEDDAKKTAFEHWPNTAITGELAQELPTPRHFEQAAKMLTADDLADKGLPLGPDPQRHIDGIKQFAESGFDHVYIHQIGPDQQGFFDFYQRQVLPRL